MIRRIALSSLALLLVAPARADKDLIRSSRITPLEIRRKHDKAAETAAKDGFGPLPRAPKIIGGGNASPGEYPWMAALVIADEPDNFQGQFCGGSLIHPRWILTASHCVSGSKASDIEVVLGTNDLDSNSGFQRIAVAEIVMAPKYNDFTLDSDFALLRLAEPASASIPTIPLIDDLALAAPGIEAVITGWGDMSNGERDYPALLQEVEVPVVDLAVANATPSYLGSLTANMLPAGYPEGGKDSCYGDSGGPMIVPSPVGPGWMQAGIVSFGAGCAEPGVYGINARVSQFRRYILGHVLPNYTAWEIANNRTGESRDPDTNGFTNFEDFALPDHTLNRTTTLDSVRLSYTRPASASEVDYIIENAPTAAGPWTVKSPSFVSSTVAGAGLVLWTVELPLIENIGVFRVRAAISSGHATGPRPFTFTSGTRGTLDSTDAGFSRAYRLEGLPVNQPVSVSLRSTDFDAVLSVEVAATGANVGTSASDNAEGLSGTDERLTFTPLADTTYIVRASGGAGDFELNLWSPVEFAAQPALVIPQTRKATLKGSLAATDVYDPFFQPGGEYLKDDFLLDPTAVPTLGLVELQMNSKGMGASGINDFLGLIDAESGRLIGSNDDRALRNNNSLLRFAPVPGKSYVLRASSALENDTGNYSVTGLLPKIAPKTPVAPLALGSSVKGKLAKGGERDERSFTAKRDFLLDQVSADTAVSLNLSSFAFDAYLVVLDATDLSIVAEADQGASTGGLDDAALTFTAKADRRYLVRATTYLDTQSGAYVLSAETAP
ncbi:serine protease [Luteolibacter sp. GHJ8]|uniref:Serine protease n=1 Tax=Luteolibacter rhizosphaerae TaxID=2989719 RepID=A0ABT3G443_9BACT|nr:serine protease [Luteolibacter rhizosphaerae]MCW1914616.1 serine protease [Luteolibacter rhizosphaerae]